MLHGYCYFRKEASPHFEKIVLPFLLSCIVFNAQVFDLEGQSLGSDPRATLAVRRDHRDH